MLYVFVGDDVVTVRAKTHAFLGTLGVGDVERVTAESYYEGILRELAGSQSLFGAVGEHESVILLDFLSESDEALEVLADYVDALQESAHIFVLMDLSPTVALTKVLKKHAKKYTEVLSGAKAERFNTFLLADALSRKDKKSLWVLLMRARLAGIAGEGLVGMLFWQIKALRLAKGTRSPEEADMKEFTYKKAKSALSNFKEGELETLSQILLRVYHDGHNDRDMDIELERFVLML